MKRNVTIDVMKGMGILLVVLGHAIQKNISDYQLDPLFNIIYSFHMPMFFAVSGYLMYKTLKSNRLNWLKNKAIYFVIPHVVFNAFYYLMSATNLTIYENQVQKFTFLSWMREALFFSEGEWFLWVLFMTLMLMLVLDWLDAKFNQTAFWVGALVVIGLLLFIPDTGKDYLRLFEIEWYFIFMFAGFDLYASQWNIYRR
jgi:fucose 4-O-acetylase-like acetyltransferase